MDRALVSWRVTSSDLVCCVSLEPQTREGRRNRREPVRLEKKTNSTLLPVGSGL